MPAAKKAKYATGHLADAKMRHIVADPNGNREQRRAAKKLAGKTTKETNMSNRTATVTAPTTAIAGTGRATTLPPGTYPVAELDGVAARGEMYIEGPDNGALVRINPNDRNITISEGER